MEEHALELATRVVPQPWGSQAALRLGRAPELAWVDIDRGLCLWLTHSRSLCVFCVVAEYAQVLRMLGTCTRGEQAQDCGGLCFRLCTSEVSLGPVQFWAHSAAGAHSLTRSSCPGNGRLEAQCIDGTKRLCHIRGKMRKKVWVNAGDIVLVGLRDFQDGKADVILKYMADEARSLKAYGELPDSIRVNETDTFDEDRGENEDYFDFDEAAQDAIDDI